MKYLKLILWIVFVLLAISFTAIAILGYLFFSTPSYWAPVDKTDPQVQASAAEVERVISSEVTLVRPADETWPLTVTEQEANAWLAVRLPQWLANQGAPQEMVKAFSNPMLHLSGKQIELAGQVDFDGAQQVVRFVFEPVAPAAPGEPMHLDLKGMYAGKLPLPVETLVAQLNKRYAPKEVNQRAEFDRAMAILRSIPLKAPLGDGRTVQVVDLRTGDGVAELKLQTKRTAKKSP